MKASAPRAGGTLKNQGNLLGRPTLCGFTFRKGWATLLLAFHLVS